MKRSDFRLLGTLPEEYDYELFTQRDGSIIIVGKKYQTFIMFNLLNGKLKQLFVNQNNKEKNR